MISEAQMVEITAFIWNAGEEPVVLKWDSKPDYESVRQGLCDVLVDGEKEFGKLVAKRADYTFEMYFRAFDDEHRGRQIVAATTPEDLDKAYTLRRQECSQKVFTPRELYQLKPISISPNLDLFLSVHMREEIDTFDIDVDAVATSGQVELRVLVDKCPDGRRTWTLETVWFKGFPVMVVNSSGRDGDEYHTRWITNLELFTLMVKYLKTFTASVEVDGLMSADTVVPAMTEFYNATIHDYYDIEKQESK